MYRREERYEEKENRNRLITQRRSGLQFFSRTREVKSRDRQWNNEISADTVSVSAFCLLWTLVCLSPWRRAKIGIGHWPRQWYLNYHAPRALRALRERNAQPLVTYVLYWIIRVMLYYGLMSRQRCICDDRFTAITVIATCRHSARISRGRRWIPRRRSIRCVSLWNGKSFAIRDFRFHFNNKFSHEFEIFFSIEKNIKVSSYAPFE